MSSRDEIAAKKLFVYLSTFGQMSTTVQQGLTIESNPGGNSLILHGKSGLKLSDDTVKVLCIGLSDCGLSLNTLALACHSITDVGALEIGKLVSNPNIGIRNLNLAGNEIRTPSNLGIANGKLEVLNLSCNPLGEAGGMELMSFVQNNNSLEALDVGCCDLNLKSSIGLITSLHENTKLKSLNIDRPLLNHSKQEETTDHLSRVILDKTSGLTNLYMRYHTFGDRGARMLSDALSR
jgi:hypothetical protein